MTPQKQALEALKRLELYLNGIVPKGDPFNDIETIRTALQSHNSCERLVEALEYIAANNGDDLVGRARTALQEHRAGMKGPKE